MALTKLRSFACCSLGSLDWCTLIDGRYLVTPKHTSGQTPLFLFLCVSYVLTKKIHRVNIACEHWSSAKKKIETLLKNKTIYDTIHLKFNQNPVSSLDVRPRLSKYPIDFTPPRVKAWCTQGQDQLHWELYQTPPSTRQRNRADTDHRFTSFVQRIFFIRDHMKIEFNFFSSRMNWYRRSILT